MSGNFYARVDVGAQLNGGIHSLQAGRLQDAWTAFSAVLQADPDNAVAHHLIGIVALQAGQLEIGIASLRQSIALNPSDPVAHGNLGNALRETGAHAEAAEAYSRAVALDSSSAPVHSNHGSALYALGCMDQAMAAYDRAVALDPAGADHHYNRANVLAALGRTTEAVEAYDRALAIQPDYIQAHINRGNLLLDLGRNAEALAGYDRAIGLQGNLAQAHSNRSNALRALNRAADALASCEAALALHPDDAEALTNRGNALIELNRGEDALASYDAAIAADAGAAHAFSNRANTLRHLGRHAEALESCATAIALDPASAAPLINRAAVLGELGRYEQALTDYASALKLDPERADVRWYAACLRLTLGQFETGWRGYEWRTRMTGPGQVVADRSFAAPLWTGAEPLAGKTILLHSEQGLGDTLQFCRYAKQVKALGARVLLEVDTPLLGVLAGLEGVDLLLEKGAVLPPCDYQCRLMSLPAALGTTLDTIPADIPYVRADPGKAAAWAERLGPRTRPRIGLVWSGGVRTDQPDLWNVNARRNIALSMLAPLADVDADFYSLQKGQPAQGEAAALQAQGWDGPQIIDHTADLVDFTDTAALIENLDLVIAVDTSTAHLAGAMGKSVWILNRFDTCWRWMLERTDSPWYPTARLFRQPRFNDWTPVMQEVKAALDAFVKA